MESQPHHTLWNALGGVFVVLCGGGLLTVVLWAQTSSDVHGWPNHWFQLLVGVLCGLTLGGLYCLAAPFLGLPLPKTRTTPLWRRSPRASPSEDPSAATRVALNEIRRDVRSTMDRIASAISENRYWSPFSPRLTTKAWKQHRPLLASTPNSHSLVAALDGAFGHISRIAELRVIRRDVRPSDSLKDALESLTGADADIDRHLRRLDAPPTARRRRPITQSMASLTVVEAPIVAGSTIHRVRLDTTMTAGQKVPLPFRPRALGLVAPAPLGNVDQLIHDSGPIPAAWQIPHGRVIVSRILDDGFTVEVQPVDLVESIEIEVYP